MIPNFIRFRTLRHTRAISATLFVVLVGLTFSASASQRKAAPPFAKEFIQVGDTVLAAKADAQLADGVSGAVLVIRHPIVADRSKNPCDLVVLAKSSEALRTSASNSNVVDCRYNELARNATEMGLDENLSVEPGKISFYNELSKGGASYTFSYDSKKAAWHLSQADSTSVQQGSSGEIEVYKASLTFPATLPWVPLNQFDPKSLRQLIEKHRKPIQ